LRDRDGRLSQSKVYTDNAIGGLSLSHDEKHLGGGFARRVAKLIGDIAECDQQIGSYQGNDQRKGNE